MDIEEPKQLQDESATGAGEEDFLVGEFAPSPDKPAPATKSASFGAFLKKPPTVSAIALVGLFFLATVGFLYFAKVVILPLVVAVMLSFLLKPVVKWLAGLKVPPALGAAIVLLVMLFALGNGITRLTKPANDFVAQLPESLRRVEEKVRRLIWHAEQLSKAAAQVQDFTKGSPPEEATPKVEVKRSGLMDTIFSATTSFIAGAIETIVLLYFLLASGELFQLKLIKLLPNFHEKKKVTAIVHEVQQSISAFLFTISIINLCLGTLVGVGVWLAGLGNPILWGVTAALLNFVPYFGPIVGVAILGLAGLLTFESVGHALVPPLIYLGLHALEANFITPTLLGRRLTLNPVVIFLSLMFWTWLWGITGALLSVPLLMILKILCDHFKTLTPIAEFLSG
jgi:predicted PurR-regulated permease PerM